MTENTNTSGDGFFKSSRKTYDLTNSPLKDQLKWLRKMVRSADLFTEETYQIMSSLKYENFFCRGISVYESGDLFVEFTTEGAYPSGVVFSTYGKNNKPDEKEFERLFEQYKKYFEGDIVEYIVEFYDNNNGEWFNTDSTAFYEESIDNVIEALELKNVVEKPNNSIYNCIKENIPNNVVLELIHYLPGKTIKN